MLPAVKKAYKFLCTLVLLIGQILGIVQRFKPHALGWIPDAPDVRDFTYSFSRSPYQFVDLEHDPAMPPVWDQGQLGSCTAHGSLAGFLFAAAKSGHSDPMLSRLQLYYNTRALEGTTDSDSGGQIRDAIKATTEGIAPEVMWPYDIAKFTVAPRAAVQQAGKAHIDTAYHRVPATQAAIQACLSEGFPVVIGVQLDPRSFESRTALRTGIIPLPQAPQDGHCMLIVGIGTGADWKTHGQFPAAVDGQVYVKVRNSWGTGVYQNGYLLMPVEYVEKFGGDYWTIRAAS